VELVATAEQMQSFDRTAIQAYEMPGLLLMENAGRGFVDALVAERGAMAGRGVLVVCGKGNNGGDGFVIARHLVNRGAKVHVALLARGEDLEGDARTNYIVARHMAGPGLKISEPSEASALQGLPETEIVVDAIFGTGFSGEASGIYRAAIELINSRRWYVAAVDIPSGVSAGDGTVGNIAVNAAMTVTMGLAKIGHYVGAGADHAGKVIVADISIPSVALHLSGPACHRVHAEDVVAALPRRPRRAHKYSVGKVFVLAGSRNFTGAPAMCAQAALVSGAGAVVLGVPRSIHATLASKLTEVIIEPLDETSEGTIAESARDAIHKRLAWADAVVVGPGLSRQAETDRFVLSLIASIQQPLILDADGLNVAAMDVSLLEKRKSEMVVTPHSGELARLTGHSAEEIERSRVESVRTAAERFHSVVVLKGAPTATADSGGDVYLNSTGNPGMATIGSGDVLTGLIAGLRVQGMTSLQAAYGGAFLHGLAGDIGAERVGQRSLLALDILDHIPSALMRLEK
jgi:ADP-dependent NAD(P)H-hydrate dehydratase / NAD(P)H-hydrate epimerase